MGFFSGGESLALWSQLATVLLSCVAEGVKLGAFLVKFTLTETTLSKLVPIEGNLKMAWHSIMVTVTSC